VIAVCTKVTAGKETYVFVGGTVEVGHVVRRFALVVAKRAPLQVAPHVHFFLRALLHARVICILHESLSAQALLFPFVLYNALVVVQTSLDVGVVNVLGLGQVGQKASEVDLACIRF
jgi:hypothetical protein